MGIPWVMSEERARARWRSKGNLPWGPGRDRRANRIAARVARYFTRFRPVFGGIRAGSPLGSPPAKQTGRDRLR
ncbi:hypothetical protein BCEP27_100258 [Burkholderia cepacia]